MAIPTVLEFRVQAKAVRTACAEQGIALTHSASLEALAKQYGFRDWNAARAEAPLSRHDSGPSPLSTSKMFDLLIGNVAGLPRAKPFDREAALRDLPKPAENIERAGAPMTPGEGEATLLRLSEAAKAPKAAPDWKRSEAYASWLAEADAFLAGLLDRSENSLAVALSTMATLTYRLPFHLGRMPNLLPFRNRYEAFLRSPAHSRAFVELHFPGHSKAWDEADARNRAEVERVLDDPSLTDYEIEVESDTRNHEITRMDERLERIQAAALEAQERGDVEAYDRLMGDRIELEGRIERAHADDEYEEE